MWDPAARPVQQCAYIRALHTTTTYACDRCTTVRQVFLFCFVSWHIGYIQHYTRLILTNCFATTWIHAQKANCHLPSNTLMTKEQMKNKMIKISCLKIMVKLGTTMHGVLFVLYHLSWHLGYIYSTIPSIRVLLSRLVDLSSSSLFFSFLRIYTTLPRSSNSLHSTDRPIKHKYSLQKKKKKLS